MDNKFILIKSDERGYTVKYVPKITTIQEIEAYMNENMSGANTWKVFGDLIWFYRSPYLCEEKDEEDEDENAEDEDCE